MIPVKVAIGKLSITVPKKVVIKISQIPAEIELSLPLLPFNKFTVDSPIMASPPSAEKMPQTKFPTPCAKVSLCEQTIGLFSSSKASIAFKVKTDSTIPTKAKLIEYCITTPKFTSEGTEDNLGEGNPCSN